MHHSPSLPPRSPASSLLLGALTLALAWTSPACTSPAKDEAKGSGEAEEPAAEPGDDARAPVSEQEAKAVFEAWLAAQVERDFDAYAAVYAEDFTGIKRNGHVTKELPREEWLAKRTEQFERGFTITATGLELSEAKPREPGAVLARFTQRWATPTFADIGPKELLIARRGGAAKVVHEEMLSSHVTRRKGRGDAPLMVLELGADHYAVLGTGSVDWVDPSATPTLLDEDTVTKPLVEAKLDARARAWIGRELELIAEGEGEAARCKAKVAALELVGRVYPSPELDDALWEIWEEREPTPAELAPHMWGMMEDELLLLGKLDGCSGSLALPAEIDTEQAQVTYAQVEAPDAQLARSAAEAFAKLPDHRAEQANYAEYLDEMKQWAEPEELARMTPQWDAMGASPLPSDVWLTTQEWSSGEQRFVFRSVAVGEGCGTWTASMWALWEVGEGGALELVGTGPESGDFSGGSALTPTRLLRWHDNLWLRTEHELYEIKAGRASLVGATEPIFYGCNC